MFFILIYALIGSIFAGYIYVSSESPQDHASDSMILGLFWPLAFAAMIGIFVGKRLK